MKDLNICTDLLIPHNTGVVSKIVKPKKGPSRNRIELDTCRATGLHKSIFISSFLVLFIVSSFSLSTERRLRESSAWPVSLYQSRSFKPYYSTLSTRNRKKKTQPFPPTMFQVEQNSVCLPSVHPRIFHPRNNPHEKLPHPKTKIKEKVKK